MKVTTSLSAVVILCVALAACKSGGGATPGQTSGSTNQISTSSNQATSRPISSSNGTSLQSGSVTLDTNASGGIIETISTAQTRAPLSQSEIASLVPNRGAFTFPAPYNTQAVRLTNGSDCGNTDCVNYVGYSYWRNINNHAGSDTLYLFLGLDRGNGGPGPTLFSFNKTTNELTKEGPLFDENSSLGWSSAEGWYFSATLSSKLYVNEGSKLMRFDIFSKELETVFDAASNFGSGKSIKQIHSSNDDRVHSASLVNESNWQVEGCMVYREDTGQFSFYPVINDFDECQIDRSGKWLVIKENVDRANGEDNRVINVATGEERVILDQNGAAGHSDLGFETMIAADNWDSLSNIQKLWQFDASTLQGKPLYYNYDWNVQAPAHLSFTNARPNTPFDKQYACGSSANRRNSAHANEIVCFRADGSEDVLVVAPVMTDMDAGGGRDDYGKSPKGNLDVTGQYFIWTSNLGGDRLDAFLVKVPGHLLIGG